MRTKQPVALRPLPAPQPPGCVNLLPRLTHAVGNQWLRVWELRLRSFSEVSLTSGETPGPGVPSP